MLVCAKLYNKKFHDNYNKEIVEKEEKICKNKKISKLIQLYFKEELEEGRQERKQEMIQGMLKDDLSINKIAQYANMDIEYILKIKSDMIKNGEL